MRLARTLVGVTVGRQGTASETHSQFFVAMLIATKSAPIYLNMFQALFAAVAVALIVFFIKPMNLDPRFGLPVGGFFAAVSNNTFVVRAAAHLRPRHAALHGQRHRSPDHFPRHG